MKLYKIFIFTMVLIKLISGCLQAQTEEKKIYDLNLHQLSEIKIVTATKVAQMIKESPSTIVIITAEELRKNDETKKIPIIALTSYAMVGDKERILAAGATGYIEKPINPEYFVTQIMQYINEYRG